MLQVVKTKTMTTVVLMLMAATGVVVLSTLPISAAHCGEPTDPGFQACQETHSAPATDTNNSTSIQGDTVCGPGEVQISVGVGDTDGDGDVDADDKCIPEGDASDLSTNPIIVYLRGIIQFLTVGVGIVVTISIVVAGIQFMTSRGNPQAIQAAIQRLTNAIIALLLFIFMAAILNFVVPGGLV